MSPYSTMNITREDCVAQIRASIEETLLNGKDEVLEDLLFEVYGRERLNNFNIVSEYRMPDKYGYPLQYRNSNSDD